MAQLLDGVDKEVSEDLTKDSLQKSVKTIGELYPILENQDGKILDGNHRAEANPKHHRKTIQTKNRLEEILVRLHAHHRRQVPQEETKALLIELAQELEKGGIQKENVTAELCKVIPFTERYVRQLMPQEYKQLEKVEAGQKGGQVSAELVHQTVKTQDMVECERCHISTGEPKTWHGHTLCSRCEEKANFNPEAYDGFFRYLKAKPAEPKQEPAFKEKWEHKVAAMSPQHSSMELKIVNGLRAKGYTVETDISIVVKETVTVPDFNIILNEKTIHGFVDGAVHNAKRKDRDEELRLLLKKRFPTDLIVAVDVKGDSDKEAEEKIREIEESIKN